MNLGDYKHISCSSLYFCPTFSTIHFWYQYLCQDIWLQTIEMNFSRKKIHKIKEKAEEINLESTATKYIQDILRQEGLHCLTHVPLLEHISKVIRNSFCPYGTLIRIQNPRGERSQIIRSSLGCPGTVRRENWFLKSLRLISGFTGEE